MRFGSVRLCGDHGFVLDTGTIEGADATVQRTKKVPGAHVVRVLAHVGLRVLDGAAETTVVDADLHEERRDRLVVPAAGERGREVLLGAHRVAEGGERFSFREELVRRLLLLERRHDRHFVG